MPETYRTENGDFYLSRLSGKGEVAGLRVYNEVRVAGMRVYNEVRGDRSRDGRARTLVSESVCRVSQ